MSSLADTPTDRWVCVSSVRGERAFRRRLLEMGLVPGTSVRVVGVAPLGDPMQLQLRGGKLSLRRAEAAGIEVLAT